MSFQNNQITTVPCFLTFCSSDQSLLLLNTYKIIVLDTITYISNYVYQQLFTAAVSIATVPMAILMGAVPMATIYAVINNITYNSSCNYLQQQLLTIAVLLMVVVIATSTIHVTYNNNQLQQPFCFTAEILLTAAVILTAEVTYSSNVTQLQQQLLTAVVVLKQLLTIVAIATVIAAIQL